MSLGKILADIDENQKTINGFRPFGPERLAQIKDFYRVATVWSSNAIEGFSYTESETKVLIEEGLTAGGKPMRDAYAVIGHKNAYEHMFTLLNRRELGEADILAYHSLLRGSLDNEAEPGHYRPHEIFVSGSTYVFPKPAGIQGEMAAFFEFVKNRRGEYHPVEFAALVHLRLVGIHPFADGNGRVARLAMNTVLIQDGFLPTGIPPILRTQYIDRLKRAQMAGHERPFLEFICSCERETQKDFIRMLK